MCKINDLIKSVQSIRNNHANEHVIEIINDFIMNKCKGVIRLFIPQSDNYGHQTNSINILKSLIFTYNRGAIKEIQLIYQEGCKSKIVDLLRPDWDGAASSVIFCAQDQTVTVKFQEFSVLDLSQANRVFFGLTGGYDECTINLANKINVKYALLLQPYQWNMLNGLWTYNKNNNNETADFTRLYYDNDTLYYTFATKLACHVELNFQHLNQVISQLAQSTENLHQKQAAIINHVCTAMTAAPSQLHLMPIYGVTNLNATMNCKPWDILFHLSLGLHSSVFPDSAPIVMLVMHNNTIENIYTGEKYNIITELNKLKTMFAKQQSAWQPEIDAVLFDKTVNQTHMLTCGEFCDQLKQLSPSHVYIVFMDKLPQLIFNYLYYIADLPVVFEGKGTMTTILNYGKPYFILNKDMQNNSPYHFQTGLRIMGKRLKPITTKFMIEYYPTITEELFPSNTDYFFACSQILKFKFEKTDGYKDTLLINLPLISAFINSTIEKKMDYFEQLSNIYKMIANDKLLIALPLTFSYMLSNECAIPMIQNESPDFHTVTALKNYPITRRRAPSSDPLTALYQSMLAHIENNALWLFPDCIDDPVIVKAYCSILGLDYISIEDASVIIQTEKEPIITVTGGVRAYGFLLCAKLEFQANEQLIAASSEFSFPTASDIFPALGLFCFQDFKIRIACSSLFYSEKIWIGGAVDFGEKLELGFGIDYPSIQNQIEISGAFLEQKLSIASLFRFLGGINLTDALPSALRAITEVGIEQINVCYDYKNNKILKSDIAVSLDANWKLLPKLEFEKLTLFLSVNSPMNGAASYHAILSGEFAIGKGEEDAILSASLSLPDTIVSVQLQEGQVALGDIVTLFMEQTIDLHAYLSDFSLEINMNDHSFWLVAGIDADQWEIKFTDSFSLALTNLSLHIERSGGKTGGGIGGTMRIGSKETGVDLTVQAEFPAEQTGVLFLASTGENQWIDLLDLVDAFLKALGGADAVPDWIRESNLQIGNLKFSASTINNQSKYEASGSVVWNLTYHSISFMELDAKLCLGHHAVNGTYGYIKGDASLLGMDISAGYEFSKTDKSLYIEWLGMRGSYEKLADKEQVKFTVANKTLGEIIQSLIQLFNASFKLAPPWDFLNAINLDGLSIVYRLQSKEIEVVYSHKIDLAFLSFDSITLLKNEQGVFLKASGSFLGLPIEDGDSGLKEGRDIQDLPQVPGLGNELFKLDYLGLGQHVALYPTTELHNMEDALSALKHCFKEPAVIKAKEAPLLPIPIKPDEPPKQPTLIWSRESEWMIGARFTILNTIELGLIFNDPSLYGLLVKISGDKLKTFNGLKFEILYKKISDSIGVYQMELQLPKTMRYLEFGAVSVTLPTIGLDIYTNGNFKIDFGFPKNLDFSKAFTIQAFPFTGSGGFYFALLNGETSKKVPQTNCGSFHPVIEFGMGLSIGVGKDISAGVLNAGLSVTLVGLLEGALAFYHPNRPDYPGKDAVYYNIQGTLGITGKIYGEINFAIIYARVDISFYAFIQITVESYNSIPIYVEAGVSLSLTVKINLGLFKIKLSLSFSTTVSASFIIGKDERALAPWNYQNAQTVLCARAASNNYALLFQPILAGQNKKTLRLYFMPHLTLAQNTNQTAFVASLYVEQACAQELVKAVLLWCVNACVNADKTKTTAEDAQNAAVTKEHLQYIDKQLTNCEALLKYHAADQCDIYAFINNYFQIELAEPNSEATVQACAFPMFPDFSLLISCNSHKQNIDFGRDSMCSQAYLEQTQTLIREMAMNFEQPKAKNLKTKASEEQNISMTELIFADYIGLIARNAVQTALKNCSETQTALELLTKLTDNEVKQILGMTTRFMLNGLSLPSLSKQDKQTDAPLYELTKQLIALPPLTIGDCYELTLYATTPRKNLRYISNLAPNVESLRVTLDDCEISRINNMNKLKLNPTLCKEPQAAPLYKDAPRLYSLENYTPWNCAIFELPAPLQEMLNLHEQTKLTLHSSKQEECLAFTTAILLNLEIRLTNQPDGAVYEIVGTDEVGIDSLQKALTYIKIKGSDIIKQLHLLYKEKQNDGRYYSQDPETVTMAIIKTNLSTETNPINRMANGRNAILNPIAEFLQQLWEASIVRSGGFYLYYRAPAPLPDSLFDEHGNGTVKLLICCETEQNADALQQSDFSQQQCGFASSFINCVMPDAGAINEQESLYILLPEITERRAIVAQGCGGVTLTRKNPGEYAPTTPYPIPANDQSSAQDLIYLENQFHLLGYNLVEDQNFWGTASLAAIGPLNQEDSTTDWIYDFVIPLAKHSKLGSTDNPYSGIGHTCKIYLEWKDLFGCKAKSAAPSYTVDLPLLYTDSLIAFSKWTGTSTEYYFKNNGKKLICFQFHYDPSRYLIGATAEEWQKSYDYAQHDAALYQHIVWQLEQKDVKISMHNSLYMTEDQKRHADLKADKQFFLNYARRIQSYLYNCQLYLASKLDGHENPEHLQNMERCLDDIRSASMFSCEIEETNAADLFALTTEIIIERTAFVHPDFAKADGVAFITNVILPRADTTDATSAQSYHYRAFAESFERLFKDKEGMFLKLAIGVSDQGTQELWAVRFQEKKEGRGISCNISNQSYYFAIKPLSATLINLSDLEITKYESGKPFILGECVVKRSFYNIDLDVWVKTLLEAVEFILSPDLAVPLYLCDNGALLKKICDKKKALAACLSSSMTSILQEQDIEDDCLAAVREKMKQRLLIRLTHAYSVGAALASAVETGCSTQDETYPIKLYGTMQEQDSGCMENYKFSNAKVPVQKGKSWLTSLIEVSGQEHRKNLEFKQLQYNITHIEHHIEKLFDDSNYLASKWLSFIVPHRLQKNMGARNIPLPLRSFPAAPSVLKQTYVYAPPKDADLAKLRQYDYCMTYQPALAAQDTIKLKLAFNVNEQDANLFSAGKSDLPSALAQFISVYPDIKNDLERHLIGSNSPNETGINAAKAFAALMSTVANAWQTKQRTATNALPQELYQFEISESPEEPENLNSRLIVKIINCDCAAIATLPEIKGYETECAKQENTYLFYKTEHDHKLYLSYQDSTAQKERTIKFTNLDILLRQNAWAGIYVARNEGLLDQKQTNADFIYQTNLIKFGSKLVPLLRSKQEFDIAALQKSKEKKSLETHLKTFFAALLETADSAFSLKIGCSYCYRLYKNAKPLTLPIFLTVPCPINTAHEISENNEFIQTTANKINAWFFENKPITEDGKLCFHVELYADAGAHTPFFALETVILKTKDFM